jgi:hypothetical protein
MSSYSPHSPLPSPSIFNDEEDIELNPNPFPKFLPPHPDKPSFFRRKPVIITLAIATFTILIAAAAAAGALFTGKSLKTAQYVRHPDAPSTIATQLPKVTSFVSVTQTSVVASTANVTVSSAQLTAVYTRT